jgi:hypothetical protein
MHANTNDVAASDACRIDADESLIDDRGVSIALGRRRGENIKPPRRNYGSSERNVTGVDEVDFQMGGSDPRHCTLQAFE